MTVRRLGTDFRPWILAGGTEFRHAQFHAPLPQGRWDEKVNAIRSWAIASERDWCYQTFRARWPFVLASALVAVLTVAVSL
jgi:hypothetical protein